MKKKLYRIATWVAALIWVSVFIIYPFATYNNGTSRNISYEVLMSPYIESDRLVYRWKGEVKRSCSVSYKRYIVDSSGQIHTLISTPIIAALDRASLGYNEYEMSVNIGSNIAEGPTVYQVYEIPRCTWLQILFPNPIAFPPIHFEIER